MADRITYKSTTPGAITGDQVLDNIAGHIARIYDAASFPLTTVAGTANAVTASLDPVLAAGLVDGMKFSVTWGAANTAGVTLAINGGAAVPVLDAQGVALVAGAVTSGLRSVLEYIGGNFRMLTAPLIGSGGGSAGAYYLAITASQTWNKPAGLDDDQMITVEAWGGGQGGARHSATTRQGGRGGAYTRQSFRAADVPSSVAVTIGAGGAGATVNDTDGGTGGTTSFGTLLSVPGGTIAGPAATTCDEIGGAGGTNGNPGADAFRAGAGGGGGATTATAGGNSVYGGDGGSGGDPSPVPTAGAAPGGGGGGGFGINGAPGARGEVRIWI